MKKKQEYGFTLLEVLLALAIIGTVSGLGISMYLQTTNAYDKAEDRWQIQSDLRMLSDFLLRDIRNAFFLEINFPTDPEAIENIEENDAYIFEDNGVIRYRDQNIVRNIIGGNDYSYDIVFRRAISEGDILENTLTFTVNAIGYDYDITSSIYLPNLPVQHNIIDGGGEDSSIIHYRRNANDPTTPDATLSSFCFIATATYGSALEEPVKILRIFRDQYLLTNKPGERLVDLYYRYSPPLANIIKDNVFLKVVFRIILLPVLLIAYLIIVHQVFIPFLILSCLLVITYKRYLYSSQIFI